ncbi:hypothetical protein CDD83_10354 [Cordyceps sp. RAO-2017]|nr:hypothetical protein CDD83_10354 [Cordyceps sp. RAO-2017]
MTNAWPPKPAFESQLSTGSNWCTKASPIAGWVSATAQSRRTWRLHLASHRTANTGPPGTEKQMAGGSIQNAGGSTQMAEPDSDVLQARKQTRRLIPVKLLAAGCWLQSQPADDAVDVAAGSRLHGQHVWSAHATGPDRPQASSADACLCESKLGAKPASRDKNKPCTPSSPNTT